MLAFSNAMMLATLPVQSVAVPADAPAPVSAPAPAGSPQSLVPNPTPPPFVTLVQADTRAVPPEQVSPADIAASQTIRSDDVVVTGSKNKGDPLRAINATSFDATQAVDRNLVGPISMAYKHKVPSPIRSGIHNFLYNLREPIVFVNFVLQLKIGKAAETVGRFAINSTAGVAGVLDIAKRKPFYLPRRSNGFANTLGYWGVPNGPFLFLPIVGPTTVRDLFGGTIDRLILPVAIGKPFTSTAYTVPAGVLGALDHRADFDDVLHVLHDNVSDPYANTRAFYLQRRQAEIDHLRGRDTKATELLRTDPLSAISAPKPSGPSNEGAPEPAPKE